MNGMHVLTIFSLLLQGAVLNNWAGGGWSPGGAGPAPAAAPAWEQPAAPAPVAAAPAAPAAPMSFGGASGAAPADANQNPFGSASQSLEWGGNDNDPSAKGNTVRLRERLNEADTDRRKAEEEASNRERAAEIRREERLKKIHFMESMPDSQPAGTGMSLLLGVPC